MESPLGFSVLHAAEKSGGDAKKESSEKKEKSKDKDKDKKEKKGSKADLFTSDLFLKIDEMIIPVIQNRQVKGAVTLIIALDTGSKEITDRLQPYQSTIQDRFFWLLYSYFQVTWSDASQINIAYMKKVLMAHYDKHYGGLPIKGISLLDLNYFARDDEEI